MQFIKNGPDVPDRLLNAHEDGKVVFFCGAGISYPAGLPGFHELTQKLMESFGVLESATINSAVESYQYDVAIGLLEQQVQGRREAVRNKLAELLTPTPEKASAIETHQALLTLSRCGNGNLHLVTTNFDRLFEQVTNSLNPKPPRYEAPLVHIPKNNFNGLVYLHGLLPEQTKDTNLDRLVVTSGDFGLAYLTEGWAAKFVSELFHRFTVCFVGYSISDPVLRYMLDAIASDRQMGEPVPEMFAFGNHSKHGKEKEKEYWISRNVTPLLYRNYRRHYYLHRTLREWASMYKKGILAKESNIAKHALAGPQVSTRQDDTNGRVLWSLCDISGIPAERFAGLDPAPPIEWLEYVGYGKPSQERQTEPDSPPTTADQFTIESKIDLRPYLLKDSGVPVPVDVNGKDYSRIALQLGRWLTHHLDDPRVALWVADNGGKLSPRFAFQINQTLQESNLSDPVCTLWQIILTDRLKSRSPLIGFQLHHWKEEFVEFGLTTTARFHLRQILTPRVQIRKLFRWWDDRDEENKKEGKPPKRVRDLVECEVELTADHIIGSLSDLQSQPEWNNALVEFLPDLVSLLHDALDLMKSVGSISDKHDLAYIDIPSISPHKQNNHHNDWVILVDLTRDAWRAALETSPEHARFVFDGWKFIRYPLFRRLEYYAAANSDLLTPKQTLDLLLQEDGWWLWSVSTQREIMRLIVDLSPKLNARERARLLNAILAGPPKHMFNPELDDVAFNEITERDIWLRLAKIRSADVSLSAKAQSKFDEISQQHPKWELSEDEREEFPSWIGDVDDPRPFERTPKNLKDLAEWLKQHPKADHWENDDWEWRCGNDVQVCADALAMLANDGTWLTDRWSTALYAWSKDELAAQSWEVIGALLIEYESSITDGMTWSLGVWLQAQSKVIETHLERFFKLIQTVLEVHKNDASESADRDALNTAINQPVGIATQALLQRWFLQELEDSQGIPEPYRQLFSELCDSNSGGLIHGRVVLAERLMLLFRVDENWTREQLIPALDWNRSVSEAAAMWEGYLWTAQLYIPLFDTIKPSFLDTAKHYDELGPKRDRYGLLLVYASLEMQSLFGKKEMAEAFRYLPMDGLEHAAKALVQALGASGTSRDEYWTTRVKPFFSSIWPKVRITQSDRLSSNLAELCVVAGNSFPQAFETVKPWLKQLKHPDYIMRLIPPTQICEQYPDETLCFIDKTYSEQPWEPDHLKGCLDRIVAAKPSLKENPSIRRFREYLRTSV